VPVILGDDAAACRAMVKPRLALYVGGMGARGRNFYNDLVCRYGYEAAARTIQDLYLSGKKEKRRRCPTRWWTVAPAGRRSGSGTGCPAGRAPRHQLICGAVQAEAPS
jgi:hypothetical protein